MSSPYYQGHHTVDNVSHCVHTNNPALASTPACEGHCAPAGTECESQLGKNSPYLNTTTVCSEAELDCSRSKREISWKKEGMNMYPSYISLPVLRSKNCRGLCYFMFPDSPVVYRGILYGEGY